MGAFEKGPPPLSLSGIAKTMTDEMTSLRHRRKRVAQIHPRVRPAYLENKRG